MNVIELNRALHQLRLGGMAAVLETRLHRNFATKFRGHVPRVGLRRALHGTLDGCHFYVKTNLGN